MRRTRTLILTTVAVVAATATAWFALPASAAAPTASVTTVSDWGTGWQSEVTISNTGASAMSSWKVEFDLPAGATIGSFWDASLSSAGTHHTFTNRSWNGSVPVDAKVTFGFIGSGGKPANCKLNGQPCGDSGGTSGDTAGGASSPSPANPTNPNSPGGSGPVAGGTTTAPTVAPTTAPATKAPTTPKADETTAVPPASNLLPVTVSNKTGRGDSVFLYVLGVNLTTGKLGYVNSAGTFTAWTGGGAVPVPAPDVAIAGPGNGASTTIKVPKNLSGRLYMSFGQKLDFRLTTGGLVQPAPWAGGDPNRDILFDWSEFTLNDSGLWLNSSQVDMFAVPHIVSVTGGNGVTSKTGELKAGGRQAVINAVKASPDFAKSVVTRADGTVLRVLAPGKAADAGLMSPTYLDSYISSAWTAYTSKNLTVVPFTDQPSVRYTGRTSGNVMNFTDASGKTVASFTKPSTANVWGCDGALAAPNDQVVGPIARTLCAALTRTTLGRLDTQPSGTAADFYQGNPANLYAKVIHENMTDGKAYAFAFDDVQNQESLVHDGDPRQAGITLTPF
ncbi:beta-1,3-glucanase family protein [Paractinoplanes atraurantiacus]|uniref:Cellulose binding domain-containing protein n=1 Tax=Paractinoplanes atraurantiacus TaxID=1036182 RepID=A0A285JA78_9ACTN|nr:beta-1,3-glucanase family protein [Actinoplanes atraurantiacus]SNY57122.1 Cellulose binding domain-containing protein [Actinoplanes atraurantiacus]